MKYYAIALLATSLLISNSSNAFTEQATRNAYRQTNLVANLPQYKAEITEAKMINAWGIAIRPKGAGGHFWVTAKDVSFEYVGDVKAAADPKLQKLHTDELAYVTLPVGGEDNFATGTVFSGSTSNFVVTQTIAGDKKITAPAKFLFASDSGIISAWTERKNADGTFTRANHADIMIDASADGVQFFGLAISQNFDRLYAADFGAAPAIRVYDGNFKPANIAFDMPFDDNKNGKVDAGEYAPFNIQQITMPQGESRIFVAYAKTQPCPDEAIKNGSCKQGELFAGEEDTSKPGHGKLAEFSEDGKLIAVWNDGGKISAPWGIALAPADFGALSGKLLVANFGNGTIAAYDMATRNFVDVLRTPKGKPVVIDKIWGLLFGNGESLGDANALYFAAGPKDETEGLFGSLRASVK